MTYRPTTLQRLERAPLFVMLGGGELQAIRGATHLARALFDELLAMADHATGRIRTSYAALITLLDVDPPARGPRPDPLTRHRVEAAFAELERRGLLQRDRIKNEKQQALFSRVAPRKGIGASEPKPGRELGRVPKANLPATAGQIAKAPIETREGTREVSQETVSIERKVVGPAVVHRAEPAQASRYVQKLKAEIEAKRGRRGNPLIRAPEGA